MLVDGALIAGDLQPGQRDGRTPGRGVVLLVAEPVHEERQLRVACDVVDADLLPAQIEPVGPAAVAVCGGARQAGFDRADVVDADGPAEPAATGAGAGPNGAAEGGPIGSGVVQCLDDLEVTTIAQGQDEIAGTERRVQTAVGERCAQPGSEPLHTRCQTL